MNNLEIDRAWASLGTEAVRSDPASILPGEPAAPAERTLRALARFESGDFAGASDDFAAVLRLQPENPVATLHAALCACRLGDGKGASAHLERGAIFPEPSFMARFLEVFWPMRFEQPALRPSPGPAEPAGPLPRESDWAAWKADGANWSRPRIESAVSRLRSEVRRCCEKDNYETAWHLSKRIAEMLPGDELAASELALMGINTGRYAEARAAVERHVEERMAAGRASTGFDPPSPGTLAVWALAMHETGEHRGALAVASRIRPEGPDDFCAHFVASVSWLMLGEHAAFRRTFSEGMDGYFLDTWELIVRPFMDRVRSWLAETTAVTRP